ncbi:MAG: DUF3800 domain-containing protein [Nitrososphaera sp.]
MFLAYVDASGRPSFVDAENFVLASLVTHESNWQLIDNGVKKIKISHFPNLPDSEVEFHVKDMMNRHGIFKNLTWDKIYQILDDVFDFVGAAETPVSIIGVLIDKTKLRKNKDAELWAHRLLFERINRHIERCNKAKIEQGQSAQEVGMMITDSEGETKDQKLRKKLHHMLKEGTLYNNLEYLIEDPLFTDSKWRNMSQLADCVAYAIRKRYRTNNTPSIHTTNWDR